jgi:uncharacterized protein YqgV (UPF0045/DUF77 family)
MLVQVAMFPTDKVGTSVSGDVAKVIDLIDRSGMPYKVTAMSTIIEGEWEPIMALLNRCPQPRDLFGPRSQARPR